MDTKYDLIIIGAGPAGEKAATKAAQLNAKVLIINKEANPGGALLTGTIPSKSIRETAYFIKQMADKELQGFSVEIDHTLQIDEIYHRHQLVSDIRSKQTLECFAALNIDYLVGEAKFIDSNQVSVKGKNYYAPKIIIATGTKPYHPLGVEFNNIVCDSDTILSITKKPNSMIIYGAGVIGCEYASIFNALGIRVTLINPKEKLMSFLDWQISAELEKLFIEQKINLIHGASFKSIKSSASQVTITLDNNEEIVADALLYCNGRQGVVENLNLQACGLQVNSRSQLEVDEHFQTANKSIYAVGDIIGFPSLASISNEQGRIAAEYALNGKAYSVSLNNMPLGIYTIPDIGSVGLTEQAVQAKSIEYVAGVGQFNNLAKANLHGEKVGFLKMLFNKSDKQLLGVHIIGKEATELIHLGQAVLTFNGNIYYFLEQAINFPTFSSIYKVAAQDALQKINS